jgi:predicted site-specific integrase-resolvase
MADSMITEKELADRWQVAEGTLRNWRSAGRGPRYVKVEGAVRYSEEDIREFEEKGRRGAEEGECDENTEA